MLSKHTYSSFTSFIRHLFEVVFITRVFITSIAKFLALEFALKSFYPLAREAMYLSLFSMFFMLPRITAAKFDADTFFAYIDKSCKHLPQGTVNAAINTAGEEMNFLVRSALSEGFNFDPNDVEGGRAGRAFKAFWGKLDSASSVTDPDNTEQIKVDFEQLGDNMLPKKYGIYCDGSAFELITTWPTDTPKGVGWKGAGWGIPGDPIAGGAWYIKDPTRRVPNGDYLGGSNPLNPQYPDQPGDDICTPKDQNGIPIKTFGATLPDANYVIMCPSAFSGPIGDQLATFGKTPEPDDDDLDWFASAGATMLHEFTHAVLSTEDAAYDSEICIDLVKDKGAEKARKNADSYMYFALASFLNQNEWFNDGASSPLQAAVKPTGVPRRIIRNDGRKIKRQNFWANGTVSSASIFPNSTILTGTASRTPIIPSSIISSTNSTGVSILSQSKLSSVAPSFSLDLTTSVFEASITISPSTPGLSTTMTNTSFSSTRVYTSPPPSTRSDAQTSTNHTRSSSSSLPSDFTTSLLSPSSESPFAWSGSWSEKITPTPISLSFLDLPTSTVAPSDQTSDPVLLKDLFFALKNNRESLTDAKLKSQYVDNVKEVKDQILALFEKLDVDIPEPDCSVTKRKREENTISESQLRDFLQERSALQNRGIFSGVAYVIKSAVHDFAALLSCAINVMDNLVDSINIDTLNIDLIQDLTDSLAAVGDALDDPKDEPTNTNPSSTDASQTTSRSTSSSSSSSCSTGTAIPICTQTLILSTSYLSGRSTFTVNSITTNTCSTITIEACTVSE